MRKSKMITLRIDEKQLLLIDSLLDRQKKYRYRGEMIRAIIAEYLCR